MKIDLHKNKEFAIKAEGVQLLHNGNHKLYKCPAGKWTIGHGYNIEDNGLPDDIAKILLERQLRESETLLEKHLSFWNELSFNVRQILIDMCFNMGIVKFLKFRKMIAALEEKNATKAAEEMKDSAWYKQVGFRSKKLYESMKSGEWHEY